MTTRCKVYRTKGNAQHVFADADTEAAAKVAAIAEFKRIFGKTAEPARLMFEDPDANAQPPLAEIRGARLRTMRDDAKMSQAQAATKAGIAAPTLSKMESGKALEALDKVIAAMGKDSADFLRGM